MTSPRTEAGRALFTDIDPGDMYESNGVTWADVVAIEEQAREQAFTEVEEAVRGLNSARVGENGLMHGNLPFVRRADLLAAIETARRNPR